MLAAINHVWIDLQSTAQATAREREEQRASSGEEEEEKQKHASRRRRIQHYLINERKSDLEITFMKFTLRSDGRLDRMRHITW